MISILKNPPTIPDLSKGKLKLSELTFQHQSPHQLDIIRPQTYFDVEKYRGQDMEPEDLKIYIDDRIQVENHYHDLLNNSRELSFTYASIVGFNKMEDALTYPGFTYYFKITSEQLEQTIFELVAGKNKEYNLEPQVGFFALESCLQNWIANSNMFKPYDDDILGYIDPRIEVIINYNIKPFAMVPEIEQRN